MKSDILIIDDDIAIRSLLGFYLGKFYSVTSKGNGLEAMLWLENGNTPDLIIVDINMPEMGGYEFLKLVRSSGFFQDIPVIILTGLDDLEVKEKCFQQGGSGFMTKPFNPNRLLSQIDVLLNTRVPSFAFSTIKS